MSLLRTRIIETDRLSIRQLTADDLMAYDAFYRQPAIRRFLPDAPRTTAETKAELAAISRHYGRYGFGLWALIDRDSGDLIGRGGLLPVRVSSRNEVALSCALAPGYWGQGLATEAGRAVLHYALEHLHLPRVIALVPPEHIAALRVARKLGLLFEEGILWKHRPHFLFANATNVWQTTIG